jgi:hypothetical protein
VNAHRPEPPQNMTEIWLQSNRRVFLPPLITAAAAAVLFLILAYADVADGRKWWGGIACAFAWAAVFVWGASRRARLAFDGRHLRINTGLPEPATIPIELIEGFFLGKGPAYLKGKDDYKTETSTLIVRVAERAPEWEKLPTDVRVAAWCGHHITLRGTWTEPLSVDVAHRLNQRLYDVQHASKSKVEVAS